jgi:AcrR family transcriptional regulator
MSGEKRPYRKTRRAELEERTRRRIAQSAAELHGTVGPARTSISAVAKRAGVRRSTVYRHFPDEAALLRACSAHWTARNPRPDPAAWAAIADPAERLARALDELYPFYGRTRPMLENLLRDEAAVPALERQLAGLHAYMADAREVLLHGRAVRGARRRAVAAALGHALAFATWRSLVVEQGLDDAGAAELMCRLVALSAGEARPATEPGAPPQLR